MGLANEMRTGMTPLQFGAPDPTMVASVAQDKQRAHETGMQRSSNEAGMQRAQLQAVTQQDITDRQIEAQTENNKLLDLSRRNEEEGRTARANATLEFQQKVFTSEKERAAAARELAMDIATVNAAQLNRSQNRNLAFELKKLKFEARSNLQKRNGQNEIIKGTVEQNQRNKDFENNKVNYQGLVGVALPDFLTMNRLMEDKSKWEKETAEMEEEGATIWGTFKSGLPGGKERIDRQLAKEPEGKLVAFDPLKGASVELSKILGDKLPISFNQLAGPQGEKLLSAAIVEGKLTGEGLTSLRELIEGSFLALDAHSDRVGMTPTGGVKVREFYDTHMSPAISKLSRIKITLAQLGDSDNKDVATAAKYAMGTAAADISSRLEKYTNMQADPMANLDLLFKELGTDKYVPIPNPNNSSFIANANEQGAMQQAAYLLLLQGMDTQVEVIESIGSGANKNIE